MKSTILFNQVNYPAVIVYQETNSFGDQKLTYSYENILGHKKERFDINHEGEWVTDKKELQKWALTVFKDNFKNDGCYSFFIKQYEND